VTEPGRLSVDALVSLSAGGEGEEIPLAIEALVAP